MLLFLLFLDFFLHLFDFHPLPLNVKPQPTEKAHVLVGDPDQGKPRDDIASPVLEEKFVTRNNKEKDGHVMAETILTGK